MKNLDRKLGRLLSMFWAVVAFIGSIAGIGFGLVVISTSIFAGMVSIIFGILFLWMGVRALRDRATLGELLNRDYDSKRL